MTWVTTFIAGVGGLNGEGIPILNLVVGCSSSRDVFGMEDC
jgi:hypothetical protein